MPGLFALARDTFGPSSLQIAHGHNYFCTRIYPNTRRPRLSGCLSDATGPLLATFLAAKTTPAAKVVNAHAIAGPIACRQRSIMKPRIGVYLSEPMAARLAAAPNVPAQASRHSLRPPSLSSSVRTMTPAMSR